MSEKKILTIYEKILAIMSEVERLQKDDRVEFGKTSYKALSEEKVTTIMRKKLLDYKLVVYPIKQTRERVNQITSVDVTYRMVNVEDPEDYIDIVSSGDGADSQDKGAGKAMTYAYKYMWLRTFALPTGEDPDKISSEELDAKQAAEAATITEKEAAALAALCDRKGVPNTTYKNKPLKNLNAKEYTDALKVLNGMPNKESA